MEKVINVLYEIEEKANKILERTSEQKTQMNDKLNEDLRSLEESIDQNTNQKIESMKQAMETEIAKEHNALITGYKTSLEKMEEKFHSHYDQYISTIFSKIVNT